MKFIIQKKVFVIQSKIGGIIIIIELKTKWKNVNFHFSIGNKLSSNLHVE